MKSNSNRSRIFGLVATTAIAASMLGGCATSGAPSASISADKAEQALAKGQFDKAIDHAEAAVLAEPHNAAYRAMLGSAYLDAGRFASAATSFDDAMKLGDNSARTALSLALSLAGSGQQQQAVAILSDWEGEIANADLGLAYALAGQPERGIHVMSNAIRAGDNTPKIRQNLAYSYALAGRWREARLMAAEDVPADKVSDRIAEWAVMAQPEAWHYRVATLLNVPAGMRDVGQPAQLALANNPSIEQLAAEASAFSTPDDAGELPALSANTSSPVLTSVDPSVAIDEYEPLATQQAASFQTAFASPSTSAAAVTQDSARFVREPVVQTAPARTASKAPASPAIVARQSDGSHLVQLGSFSSEQGARRAWGIYVKRYPELSNHQMVISEAEVRGKRYWRVSAGGFGQSGSKDMCGRVKTSGHGCFAYAEGRPLPGAIDTGTRMAMR